MKTPSSCPDCTTPLPSVSNTCDECGWICPSNLSNHENTTSTTPRLMPTFSRMIGGEMWMGSPYSEKGRDPDETLHRKVIQPFWIANIEVTQGLYYDVMRSNPSTHKHPLKPIESLTWFESLIFCNTLSTFYGREQVYTALYTETPTYNSMRNGFRLPTEAEWEWMAKHHPQQLPPHQNETGWTTQPTDANNTNLQWVLGNVWEFCWDTYTPYQTDNSISLDIPHNAKVVRGGSWVDQQDIFRPANRAYVNPHNKTDTIGFRLALSFSLNIVDP